MERTQALELLQQYNKEPFHIQHAVTVEAVMGYFADQLGYGADKAFWQTVGLLHDLDFEMYPEQHCVKEMAIMTELGLDPKLIHGQPRLWHLLRHCPGARDGKGALCHRRAHRSHRRGD